MIDHGSKHNQEIEYDASEGHTKRTTSPYPVTDFDFAPVVAAEPGYWLVELTLGDYEPLLTPVLAWQEVLDHPARSRVIEASGAVDACFAALRAGNLDYFHALLEREEQYLEPRDRDRLRRFCRQWARDLEAGRPSRIFLEGLQRLAAIAAGHVVANATFRASAKRYGLKPKPLWNKHERKTGRGIVVRFQSNDTLGGRPPVTLQVSSADLSAIQRAVARGLGLDQVSLKVDD
ncbi:MAG: hypothetical protein ACLFSI_03360 [Halorhodospira sp.]